MFWFNGLQLFKYKIQQYFGHFHAHSRECLQTGDSGNELFLYVFPRFTGKSDVMMKNVRTIDSKSYKKNT